MDILVPLRRRVRAKLDLQPGPAGPVTQEFSTAKRAYFVSEGAGLSGYVAELTVSSILADLALAHRPRPDHAAYLASWLEVLNEDPRAVFTAASKAQQAADWMHAQQPGTRPPSDAASALPAAA